MIDDEMTRIEDNEITMDSRGGERLKTADMAAAATAPTKTKRAATETEGNPDKAAPEATEESFEPLFDKGESEGFQSRWYGIQAEFVDQPHRSVEEADELVATVMKRLAEVFAAEREKLEQEFTSGEDVSTEDLRIALRRYRSFFERLLAV
jgi:hypothetical protein